MQSQRLGRSSSTGNFTSVFSLRFSVAAPFFCPARTGFSQKLNPGLPPIPPAKSPKETSPRPALGGGARWENHTPPSSVALVDFFLRIESRQSKSPECLRGNGSVESFLPLRVAAIKWKLLRGASGNFGWESRWRATRNLFRKAHLRPAPNKSSDAQNAGLSACAPTRHHRSKPKALRCPHRVARRDKPLGEKKIRPENAIFLRG